MFERFTDRARKIMAFAGDEATRLGHDHIGTEHVLVGFLVEGSGVGANVLKNLGVDLKQVRADVDATMVPGKTDFKGKFPHTGMVTRAIELAYEESAALGHNYVGTEHLLLGLLRLPECRAAVVLMKRGVEVGAVRAGVVKLLSGG